MKLEIVRDANGSYNVIFHGIKGDAVIFNGTLKDCEAFVKFHSATCY